MSMCNCNQGRLPCTCKPIEGATVMSEVIRFYAGDDFSGELCVYASDFDRVTAERDALQKLLNASDQQVDDAATENNERELSRRDWFEEAQRLQAELDKRPSQIAMSLQTKIKGLQAKLAERDALLNNVSVSVTGRNGTFARIPTDWFDRRDALSASAEPAPQVERDERAEFEREVQNKAERFQPDYRQYGDNPDADYKDANLQWAYELWLARAALDCPDCGDTGVEPCSKHGWKP